ncbi:hypothetical protein OOZ19_02705 [Saccharopolyspora sp. NFXS83]|uniref:hypothetical protein n=1 Tax=Saccharopolyspora sp. NFXS83 TaxID=2993560 RepID=UPI00224AAA71|nr:hypothetical protein [Saccharopolyspora sp. NFXS83]MCX2729138.1 hypothetical protein [Saccharopolyspora sp. NFXS83]
MTIRETAARQQMLVGERASSAAAAGTEVEYYDFASYGHLAVVFSPSRPGWWSPPA